MQMQIAKTNVPLQLKYILKGEGAKVPTRAHPTDAGLDLYARDMNVREDQGVITYYTGLYLQIPSGYFGDIRPRSSIYKTDLLLCNSPGTIDEGYRGEVLVKFRYLRDKPAIYQVGDRIAQLLILPCAKPELIAVSEFEEEADAAEAGRGVGGFGSTGR